MADRGQATIKSWLTQPLEGEVRQAITRLSRADDVARIAVMPDVHLGEDVCVGVVLATRRLVYPMAVGGDIGCGMATIGFEVDAAALNDPAVADALLQQLSQSVPIVTRRRADAEALPRHLHPNGLSESSLAAAACEGGLLELGTLGRGNHFLEFQRDAEDRLWAMVHSGSRIMGQKITSLHLSRGARAKGGLIALDTSTPRGQAYVNDLTWARAYAKESRSRMLLRAADVVRQILRADPLPNSLTDCDHNHIETELHFAESLIVHRKGASRAGLGETGLIPGSMGTPSFHVHGRGEPDSLCSASHGAGRAMSRSEARQRITTINIERSLNGVRSNVRNPRNLAEECPLAYKDIGQIMRAQRDLVRIVRRVEPVASYKGG